MGEKANKISITSRRTKLFLCIVAGSFALLLNAAASFAADYRLSYSGRLTQSDGAPVSGPVDMTVKFWTDISSGNTLGSQIDYTAVPLNQGVFSLPLELNSAQVAAIFRDGSEPVYIEVTAAGKTYPRQQYNYVPYALRVPVDGSSVVFDQNGNLGLKGVPQASAGSYLTSDGSGGVSWQSPSFGSLTPQSVSASKPSSGQVLTFDGGQWLPKSVSITGAGGGTVTSLTAGAGLTGGTITNSGTIGLANVGTAGTYAKVVTDAQGRVTSGSSLIAADLPPLSAALITSGTLAAANGGTGVSSTATFPLSGVVVTETAIETLTNKILSGATINGASSISGSTTINTTSTINSGAQTVSGNVTIQGNNTTANKLVLNDKGSANSVSLKAPDNLTSSIVWELPSTNGSAGQVLSTNGSGTLSWVSAAAGSVTNVNGTAPISVTTGTSTPVISMPQANGATNGYLSSADWTTFSNKQAAGNYITELTGDITATGPGSAAGTLASVAIQGTSTKVTYDVKGRVRSGTSLTAADIPPLSADLITSGTLSAASGGTGVSSTATFPTSGVVVTRDEAETLTNKTLSAAVISGASSIGGSTTINTTGTAATGALTAATVISQGNATILGNGTAASKLILSNKDNTNSLAFKAPDSFPGSVVWTLPGSDGISGQLLTTNGSGTLSWASGASPVGSAGGDLSGSFPSPTVATVGSSSAAAIHSAELAANAATAGNTASTLVKRDASGNFSAGNITANLTGSVTGNITGNLTGNASTATSATSFTGPLSGDVTGTQGATSVASVGGVTAVNVASGATLANSAVSINTPSTIIKRDGSGNFSAGTITANLSGTAWNATSAVSFTGPLSGDVTGTQGTTVVSTVGTSSAANIHAAELAANAASSSNSSLALVKRDSNGGFSSGQISATTPNATAQGLVVKGSASQTANLQEWQDSTGAVLSAMSSAGYLKLKDSDGTDNYVSLRASPTMAANLTYTLPGTVSAGAYLSTDASGNLSWSSPGSFTGSLSGDVTGTQGATVVATISGVSAASVAAGANLANAATNVNAASKLVARDGSGNFSAGTITANLTGTASNAASAVSFTGPLSGDVTGTQGATSVATVGGVTATSVASGATLANSAVSTNTASTLVKRDASGNFSAGTITANLTGNVTGNVTGNLSGTASTATSATSFTGSLAGDVSGSQGTTTVTKLQGQAVASTAPSSGQVLTWSGSTWSPQTPSGGGSSSLSIATKSADYTITAADAGKYFLVSGAMTTLTLPAASSVSSGFSITVKGVGGWAIVTPSGTDQIDGSTQSVALTNQAILQIVTDGTAWYQGYSFGSTYRGTPVACGANCYSNSSAISAGLAYTATGKTLLLTNSIWVQANGTNVLKVDGSDNWHLALNSDGKSYSANPLNKNTATIGGRTCPASVYIDDTNKVASGRCVYYDQGNLAQRLDAPNGDGVTDQTTAGSFRIGSRASTAGFWYSGNIQTCANKGMRLPTLYETTAAQPAATYLPVDATNNPTPSWSTMLTGVPMAAGAAYSWTASAYTSYSLNYWIWVGTTTNNLYYSNTYAVRCIVP